MWIQSVQTERSRTWYQLRRPAPEYARYHEQFRWLADFSKHFIDFLHRHQDVNIRHFRRDFHREIQELHGSDPTFQAWLAEYGHRDFRRVVTANPDFLYKEAINIEPLNEHHPIWNEIHPKYLSAVGEQTAHESLTVVTPFVYRCFKDTPWGRFLCVKTPRIEPVQVEPYQEGSTTTTTPPAASADGSVPSDPRRQSSPPKRTWGTLRRGSRSGSAQELEHLKDLFDDTDEEMGLTPKRARMTARSDEKRERFVAAATRATRRRSRDESGPGRRRRPRKIRVGDVVGVEKDSRTTWRSLEDVWFAYVQEVKTNSRGEPYLHVIWLYAPSDTTCSIMHYPVHNELFFSDNCNCADARLEASDVVCRISVDFFGSPDDSEAEYIVRQKYRTDDAAFVTFKRSDFKCVHLAGATAPYLENIDEKYRVGDTVLYVSEYPGKTALEPAEILAFKHERSTKPVVHLRRLRRRKRDFGGDASVRPNELVYTDEVVTVPARSIDRKCHVRFFTDRQKRDREIPPPYNRDGTADAYYITCQQVGARTERRLEPLNPPFLQPMKLGFDPSAYPPRPTLRGMDLYCGGGNFGRGLEEGGAVEMKWAVDYDRHAIHTYHANLDHPEETALYFGSVNDLLARAIKGRFDRYVPAPGEVDFISAGSPCQGFSNANQRRSNDKSLKNSSLVASVAAFVDFYRPRYALLENVVSMASKGKKNQACNVFSQLLCTLVGMGYQVQQFNLDAWSFGSPQSRSRLFISIAAPGLALPSHPPLSHSHPALTRDRGLGVAANGLSFGMRRFESTPFEYVTAAEGTADLPWIGDARTQICIPYPDHRNSRFESYSKRVTISQIPVAPRGQTYMTAFKRGWLGKPQIDEYRWENRHKASLNSRSWQRVNPNGLMPTITTSAQPSCSFTGTILHWDQSRILTVMEARRAQSFPDEDVLVGLPAVQWKIVGNSVARTVALALGLSLREAWLLNDPDHGNTDVLLSSSVTGLVPHPAPGAAVAAAGPDDYDGRSSDEEPVAPGWPRRATSESTESVCRPKKRSTELSATDTYQEREPKRIRTGGRWVRPTVSREGVRRRIERQPSRSLGRWAQTGPAPAAPEDGSMPGSSAAPIELSDSEEEEEEAPGRAMSISPINDRGADQLPGGQDEEEVNGEMAGVAMSISSSTSCRTIGSSTIAPGAAMSISPSPANSPSIATAARRPSSLTERVATPTRRAGTGTGGHVSTPTSRPPPRSQQTSPAGHSTSALPRMTARLFGQGRPPLAGESVLSHPAFLAKFTLTGLARMPAPAPGEASQASAHPSFNTGSSMPSSSLPLPPPLLLPIPLTLSLPFSPPPAPYATSVNGRSGGGGAGHSSPLGVQPNLTEKAIIDLTD